MRSKMREAVGLSLLGMLLTGCVSTELQASVPSAESQEDNDDAMILAATDHLRRQARASAMSWSSEPFDVLEDWEIERQGNIALALEELNIVPLGHFERMEGSAQVDGYKSVAWEGRLEFARGEAKGRARLVQVGRDRFKVIESVFLVSLHPHAQQMIEEDLREAEAAMKANLTKVFEDWNFEESRHLFDESHEYFNGARLRGTYDLPVDPKGAMDVDGRIRSYQLRGLTVEEVRWHGGVVCESGEYGTIAGARQVSPGVWRITFLDMKYIV